ncbi:phosphopantothenoylcysteine decarboxylase [Treponema sp.]|uniref:phosphopantothenoylcysteine decarboxylase domain-containing protein n=1 Tax=Treponema sp. TaxID=166 RepID=UPI00257C5D66|nr:phosphopantothenoylcysteine decarboxylase [Treponema sp.]
MNILITGGGCEEAIDSVRSVCNFSTGKTACKIASTLLSTKPSIKITAIMAEKAEKPEGCTVRTFRSFSDLEHILKEECTAGSYDAVIHAAAVSDYSPEAVIIDGKEYPVGLIQKISSEKSLLIKMKKNPKLIESIKSWTGKNCTLVGFKLTSNATRKEQETAVAKMFSAENPPDLVAANDLSLITPDFHPFRLYKKTGLATECSSIESMCGHILRIMI